VAALAIIIVSWNTRDRLADCLASVYACAPPLEFEVWVVDNASTDGSAALVRARFPQARLIENTANLGFARANNQALRAAAADHLLLLNSDAALLPGALDLLLDWLARNPRTAIVGPTLLNPDGSFQASHGNFPTLWSQLLVVAGLGRRVFGPHYPSHGPPHTLAPQRADWVGGACLLARRAAVDAVGLLDESFFMYAEEMDWCYRMRQGGWDVMHLPAAHCLHWGAQSSQQVRVRTQARLACAALHFFRKHYGLAPYLVLRAGVAALGLARAALFAALFAASFGRRLGWQDNARASWQLAAAGFAPCASST
jgi:GT2 family glycosyltransferase